MTTYKIYIFLFFNTKYLLRLTTFLRSTPIINLSYTAHSEWMKFPATSVTVRYKYNRIKVT